MKKLQKTYAAPTADVVIFDSNVIIRSFSSADVNGTTIEIRGGDDAGDY